jgi:hypothetical protein
MSVRGAPRVLALVLMAALAFSVAAIAAPAPSTTASADADAKASDESASIEAKPADLKEARSRLAKAPSPADYAAMLDSFSTALAPSDALALLDQGIALAGPGYRRALLVKAADLDLLVGLFGEAASRYEAAASSPLASSPPAGDKDLGLLLRAARCAIAAGDAEKASALSADVLMATEDPDLAAAARLVGAWALAMQGRAADASSIASAIAGAPKAGATALSADRRREASFLVWLCAEAVDKVAAASALASEFPGSPEALIAAGSVSTPPLPHWYLGGLDAAQVFKRPAGAVSAPAPSSVAPVADATAGLAASPAGAAGAKQASPAASTAQGKRLQVGYFSREDNAQALKEELGSKGFAAAVEPRMRAVGAGKAEEKRWIVVVEGGKDIAKTQQSLKDAGYESYIID